MRVTVGLQLAGALAAVHAAGVVYRDLHPGNVSRHPECFVHYPPAPRMPPAAVYINPPLEPVASTIDPH